MGSWPQPSSRNWQLLWIPGSWSLRLIGKAERESSCRDRIIYLDGIHFTMWHRNKTDTTMILTALGSIWRTAEKCWPACLCIGTTKTAGVVSCKTCAHEG